MGMRSEDYFGLGDSGLKRYWVYSDGYCMYYHFYGVNGGILLGILSVP